MSECSSSLDRDKIFRRDTISPTGKGPRTRNKDKKLFPLQNISFLSVTHFTSFKMSSWLFAHFLARITGCNVLPNNEFFTFFWRSERERVKRLIIRNDDKSSVWAEFPSTHVLHHTKTNFLRVRILPLELWTDQLCNKNPGVKKYPLFSDVFCASLVNTNDRKTKMVIMKWELVHKPSHKCFFGTRSCYFFLAEKNLVCVLTETRQPTWLSCTNATCTMFAALQRALDHLLGQIKQKQPPCSLSSATFWKHNI